MLSDFFQFSLLHQVVIVGMDHNCARPGWLSALPRIVFHMKSALCGVFIWAMGCPTDFFLLVSARAVQQSGKPGKKEIFKGPDVNHFDDSYFAGKERGWRGYLNLVQDAWLPHNICYGSGPRLSLTTAIGRLVHK